jgi:hypothetical protein
MLFIATSVWLATVSIELSTISTIGIFFAISFLIIWLYAQLINIFLLITRGSRGQLIDTRLNYHVLQAEDAIRQTLSVNLPRPWGFIIRFRVVVPPRLGEDIRVTGLIDSKSLQGKDTKQFGGLTAVSPNIRSSASGEIELVPQYSHRGEYKLGPIVVEYSDMFGLVQITLVHEEKEKLKIIPKLKPIDKLAWIAPTKKIGDDQAVKMVINSDELYDIRRYVRGDDPRRINWKVSAKRMSSVADPSSELILRKPEITFITLGDFIVIIDNQKPLGLSSFDNAQGSAELLDRMVDTAASILDYAARYKTNTKLFYFSASGKLRRIDPLVNRREEWLLQLASISWVSGRTNSFQFNIEETELKAAGIYLLTAETNLERLKSIESSVEAGSTNLVYFPAESYVQAEKVPEKGWKKKVARVVTNKEEYNLQTSSDEGLKKIFLKQTSKVKPEDYQRIAKSSVEVQGYLRSIYKLPMIVKKEDNYVRLLETGSLS